MQVAAQRQWLFLTPIDGKRCGFDAIGVGDMAQDVDPALGLAQVAEALDGAVLEGDGIILAHHSSQGKKRILVASLARSNFTPSA